MKNYISLLSLILATTSMQSQDINDALRYSQTESLGTARFRALSGAFGALGGDLSAININPASSVIFNNNQVAFTLGNYNTKNNSNYFGTKSSDSNSSIDLNQAGGVFVFENNNESEWKKFAFSLNYENQNNFDNSLFISGTNPNNSIDDYFLNYANGIQLGVLQNFNFEELSFREQQAYLGYNAYIIDPIPLVTDPTNYNNPNITQYSSAVIPGDFYHENSVETTGYNGKLAFNASANYQDRLMIGINLNSHFSDYVRSSQFFESNDNNTSTDNYVKRIYFDNYLHTYGNGFSFQIGAILKLGDQFRVGATYESPTWHKLTDELSQSVVAVSGNNTSELAADIVDPNITMVFAPYKIQTPGKLTGSAAFIFGKQGFISVDYSSKDYSTMRLKPESDYTNDNNQIDETFTTSNELRIGGEYKIEKWSLRAGFRSETSPYKDENIMGDLKGYSGGLGYNFGGTKLDFAYSTSERDYGHQIFTTGLVDRAKTTLKNNNVTVTLSFEL
ncbi:OmpP1/FadL family transporter [Flavobacterium sp. GCM10023249]|uniref:OmpP1/FadL family transporter n=1 Tax=unclassified Flavobacterium TaxID=196869 RepID=UPI003618D4F5